MGNPDPLTATLATVFGMLVEAVIVLAAWLAGRYYGRLEGLTDSAHGDGGHERA